MKTYPYQTPDGIIELVEKREYNLIALALHDMQNLLESEKSTRNRMIKKCAELERELQDAVKRMETVPVQELDKIWDNAPGGSPLVAIDAVRARLIQAAKGEA